MPPPPSTTSSSTCVESPEPLLRAADLAAVRWPKRDLPKIFVDLSVPRAIDPAVSGLNDAFLFDLDALQAVVAQHLGERLSEVDHAEQIVIDEVRKFLALRDVRGAHSGRHRARRAVRARAAGMGRGARAPRRRRTWTRRRRTLSRKLLAIALRQMKAGARLTQSEAALERSWRRYREQHR